MREKTRKFVDALLFGYCIPGSLAMRIPRNVILYVFYGCISTLVDWGFFYVFNLLIGIHYIPSATIAFVFSSGTNFVTNKYLNFENRSEKIASQYAVHFVVSFIGLLLVYLFLYVFIDILHVHRMVSKVITSLILAVYGYFAHKNITFGSRHFSS